MLETLRTRSGQILVVILALLAVLAMLAFSSGIAGNDASGSAILTTIRETISGGFGRAYKGRSSSKSNAKAANAAAAAEAAGLSDFRTSTTLHGTAFTETNAPLAAVKISLRRAGTIDILKTVNTDDKGHFSLDSLSADTYDIMASHDKFVPLIRPSLTIQPHDQHIQLDFHLPLGADINGLVSDEEGKPLPHVRVAARKQKAEESRATGQVLLDDSTYHTQMTDTPGTFTLTGIAQGTNVFEFYAQGYAMERMVVDISPEKAAEQMKVTLKRTGKLLGVVLDENNNPVSTATVSLTRYKPLQSAAEPIDKGKMTATTNAAGEFKFEKLYNDGYYDLLVEEPQFAPGIFPLVSVNSDRVVCQIGLGGDITGKTQLIDRPTTPVPVLVRATSVIKGTTYTQEARSDGAGKFKFKKLPYGTYSLKVDDGKFISEPKDGVACEREKPVTDLVMEIFETAKVSGRVMDAESEASVAGAKVTLTASYGFDKPRTKTFTAMADGHGMFEFPRLPAGVQTAQAEALGFLKGQSSKSQQSFVIVPGERKNDLTLFLDHGASVEGFVLDSDGRSVDNADIQLFAATQFDGPVNAANWKGHTDGTGYFKIWGIEVGERVQLYATASKTGYTKSRSDMIELSPKAMNEAIQITMARGGVVTGIVTDSRKMPIPGAEIRLDSHAFPGDPSPSNLVVHSESNGTFRIDNCPAGGVALKVSRAGYVSEGRSLTIRNEKISDNINFELEIGQTIAGIVADLEGYPIAGAKVTATGIDGAAGSETDTTNKKGQFELNNLGQGDFRLVATFPITTPEGVQNYSFTNPRVKAGNIQTAIDCDLGNTTSGKVKGEKGKGVPNFTVTLNSKTDSKPSQDFVFNLGRGMKDAGGYFRMSKLPRGLYKLTVTADGYEPHVEDEVAIGPHRRTVLSEIRLNPAGGVVGRVFSTTSDRPVNNAAVSLVSVDDLPGAGPPTVCNGTTNMRGEFRVSTVPQGLYKVAINHPSYVGLKMEMIHVTEKKERDLGKLYMEPGGAVRGTVVNNFGDPMPNMQVLVSGVTPAKQATTDAAGNYLIQGVQFGHWPVVVKGAMAGKPMYTFQTSDIQRDETARLDFTLEQTSDLSGRVIASADTALNSTSINIHALDEHNVVLEDVCYRAPAHSSQYKINEVPPGPYFLWASGQSSDGPLNAWKNIFLQRGKNTQDIEIASGKVQGTITDKAGNPVPNVAVQVLPVFNAPALTQNLYNKLIRPAITGVNGNFSFSNMQPGTYQLINQDPTASGWYAQPIFNLSNGQQLQGLSVLLND